MEINTERLSYYRKRSGISQEEFGKRIGVSKQMVSHWENGRNIIPPKYHDKIAKVLDVEFDKLRMIPGKGIKFYGGEGWKEQSKIVSLSHEIRSNKEEIAELEKAAIDFRNDGDENLAVSIDERINDLKKQNERLKKEIEAQTEQAKQDFELQQCRDADKSKMLVQRLFKRAGLKKANIDVDKFFPVISEAAAISCNTSYVPIDDYAQEKASEQIYFSNGQPGDVVIKVSGDSMLPWYPAGTLILVRPNKRPRNGERVVAILEDGEIVFKIFAQGEGQIHLFSLNDNDGNDYHFDLDDHNAIRSLWIVIQSMRDEHELDKAMENAGIHHRWEEKLKCYKKDNKKPLH